MPTHYAKFPRERLALWPLSRREWWTLRLLTPWLNPITWLLAAATGWAVRRAVTWQLLGVVAGLVVVGFVLSDIGGGSWDGLARLVPAFPSLLGQLIRKNLRQMICTPGLLAGAHPELRNRPLSDRRPHGPARGIS